MNKRITGIMLIIMGMALIMWGYNYYHAAQLEIGKVIGGDIPMQTWLGMIGGVINVFVGIRKLDEK